MVRKLIVGVIVVNFLFMLASVFAPSGFRFNDAAHANTTLSLGASAAVPFVLELNGILKELVETVPGSGVFDMIDFDSNPAGLDFGELQPVPGANNQTAYLGGQTAYAAVMYPASSGRPYKITFTGEPLSNGAGGEIGTGPDNGAGQVPPVRSSLDAYLVVPDYQSQDCFDGTDTASCDATKQNTPPPGASIGTVVPAATAVNHDIYTSGLAGFGRIIRAYLGIGGPPAPGQDPIQSCSGGHDGDFCIGPQEYDQGAAWDLVTPDQPGGAYTGGATFTLTLN